MKKILLTLLCICLAQISQSQIPSYVPKDSLVGWWPFNGNANDESGNGNNGTVTGAVISTDKNGSNSCYSFDGFGDYIDCGGNSKLKITESLTLSMWFNSNNFSYDHGLISNYENGGGFDLVTSSNNSIPPLDKIRWMDQGGFLFSNSIKTNVWYHLTVVFDSKNSKKHIYLDGKLIASSASTVTKLKSTNSNFYIGSHQPLNVNYWSWNGKLDDVAIWNRALDSNEIKGLFNSCSKKITTEPQSVTTFNRFASFSCDANDTLQKFQWQKLVNGTWTNLKDSGQYSGSTTNKLFVNHLRKSNKNDQYRCQISGSCLNSVTQVATLIYECKTQPKVIPKNYGLFGGNAFFVSNNNDTLVTYQWQTNQGTGWNNLFNAGQYSGVNNDTLIVENVSTSNNGQLFRCIISGDCGKDTSSEAKLSVWGVNTIKLNNDNIKLYPNPVKNLIEIDGYNGNSKIEIFNVSGQRILGTPFSRQIDAQGLNSGLYLLKLDNIQFKFIKE